jgi:hypothetical protein
MYAAENGHLEAVKALVAADPDPAHLNMEVSVPEKGVSVVYKRETQRESVCVHRPH